MQSPSSCRESMTYTKRLPHDHGQTTVKGEEVANFTFREYSICNSPETTRKNVLWIPSNMVDSKTCLQRLTTCLDLALIEICFLNRFTDVAFISNGSS